MNALLSAIVSVFLLLLNVLTVSWAKVGYENWVDLTHPLSTKTPVHPAVYTPLIVNPEKSKAGTAWPSLPVVDGIYIAFRYLEFYEHTGTHIDAPSHFQENGRNEDDLTWDELTGPLVVVHLQDTVGDNENFEVTRDHLEEFESKHGSLDEKSFIVFNTGWRRFYWTDPDRYVSKAPYLGPTAVDWIVENQDKVLGVGFESLCPECHEDAPLRLHTNLLPNNKLIIENVGGDLDSLPAKGANLMIFPMHLTDGTGSPSRLIAVKSLSETFLTRKTFVFAVLVTIFKGVSTF